MTEGTSAWAFAVDENPRDKLPDAPLPRPRIAPPHAEVIKQTRSICPTCRRILDADVGVEGGLVWMYKACPQHGQTRGLVEKDVAFYRATMNRPPVQRLPYHTVVIPVTHRCNLECALCFVPRRERDDLALCELERLIDAFGRQTIALSGGEPTLRDDLPDLIRHVRKAGRDCQVFTNAIKLADPSYLRRLVDTGLQYVLFSLNGLRDATYETINGQPLLDVKLRALENCVREKLLVTISPTLFRDVNEQDVAGLVRLCLDNFPYTWELRMRGAARVGRHGSFLPLTTAEQLRLVADAVGEDVPHLLSQFRPEECYHSAIQFNMFAVFDTGAAHPLRYWDSGYFLKDRNDDVRMAKVQDTLARERGASLPPASRQGPLKHLAINIWGWPDADNLDFQEIWSHGVYHLRADRTPMNFCEAVLDATQL